MKPPARPPIPFALLTFWARRILPMWGGVALVIFFMQIAVSGIVYDNESVRTMLRFLDLLPSIVKAALGGDMLRAGNTTGLIAVGYLHPLVLLLYMLFAVGTPVMLLSREVQQGTMELILSRFVSKTQVYACAGVLTLAGMFALTLIMFLGTVVAVQLYDFGQPVDLAFFFRLAVNSGLLAGAAGGFALLGSAAYAGRPSATALPVAFLVLNYLIWVVSQWWPPCEFLRPWTMFHYVGGPGLVTGWPWRGMGVLSGILCTAVGAGCVLWRKRDL